MTMNITRKLIDFALNTKIEDIPEACFAVQKHSLMDALDKAHISVFLTDLSDGLPHDDLIIKPEFFIFNLKCRQNIMYLPLIVGIFYSLWQTVPHARYSPGTAPPP